MSTAFLPSDWPERVDWFLMGDGEARLFFLITNAYAEYFHISEPVLSKIHADGYTVHEEAFCKLVEIIYEKQNPQFFFEWFGKGAALYEAIKGKRYNWVWRYPPRGDVVVWRLDGFSPEE